MVVDTTLQFAQRRNIPVRSNRELTEKVLQSMKRVSEIRLKRERVFYKTRMAGNKEKQRLADRKLVAENDHLLPKMRASERLAMEAANLDLEEEELPAVKAKVFGKIQQRKQKLLVDGGVEDEMDVDWARIWRRGLYGKAGVWASKLEFGHGCTYTLAK